MPPKGKLLTNNLGVIHQLACLSIKQKLSLQELVANEY
jgi:hypothetical protein